MDLKNIKCNYCGVVEELKVLIETTADELHKTDYNADTYDYFGAGVEKMRCRLLKALEEDEKCQ